MAGYYNTPGPVFVYGQPDVAPPNPLTAQILHGTLPTYLSPFRPEDTPEPPPPTIAHPLTAQILHNTLPNAYMSPMGLPRDPVSGDIIVPPVAPASASAAQPPASAAPPASGANPSGTGPLPVIPSGTGVFPANPAGLAYQFIGGLQPGQSGGYNVQYPNERQVEALNQEMRDWEKQYMAPANQKVFDTYQQQADYVNRENERRRQYGEFLQGKGPEAQYAAYPTQRRYQNVFNNQFDAREPNVGGFAYMPRKLPPPEMFDANKLLRPAARMAPDMGGMGVQGSMSYPPQRGGAGKPKPPTFDLPIKTFKGADEITGVWSAHQPQGGIESGQLMYYYQPGKASYNTDMITQLYKNGPDINRRQADFKLTSGETIKGNFGDALYKQMRASWNSNMYPDFYDASGQKIQGTPRPGQKVGRIIVNNYSLPGYPQDPANNAFLTNTIGQVFEGKWISVPGAGANGGPGRRYIVFEKDGQPILRKHAFAKEEQLTQVDAQGNVKPMKDAQGNPIYKWVADVDKIADFKEALTKTGMIDKIRMNNQKYVTGAGVNANQWSRVETQQGVQGLMENEMIGEFLNNFAR